MADSGVQDRIRVDTGSLLNDETALIFSHGTGIGDVLTL